MMLLFSDYIQPLTLWLQNHPHWALLITFFIALTESLAIIGSIIPGSVTMTAIGILAGSGIMRIDLTFFAAVLGAVAGDNLSYLLGYIFRESLLGFWPFKRYPHWVEYGQEYFKSHGGKSVLLGRFVGPLRSLIPVIAGMMNMNQWRFLIVNIISAIGWSILYVLPGVLIGTASSELSPEIATRLFLFILFFLASLWLLSVGLSWLLRHLGRFLHANLHRLWQGLSRRPFFTKMIKFLTPKHEQDHYSTATLFFSLLLGLFSFALLIKQVIYSSGLTYLNEPIFLFLQSLRTHPFDIFFTLISQLASPITLTTLVITIACINLYSKDYRSFVYWISLNLVCALLLQTLHDWVRLPTSQHLYNPTTENLFPLSNLSFCTIIFMTGILYMNTYCNVHYRRAITIFLLSTLLSIGFSFLYLGDNWFTESLSAYLLGLCLTLLFWLFYRRKKPGQIIPSYFIYGTLFIFLLSTTLSCVKNYNYLMNKHQHDVAQFMLKDDYWWNQTEPLLPLYRTNRIGHPVSLFNIQYAGSLTILEQALIAYGWQKQDDSLFNSIIKRVGGRSSSQDFPLMAQLYLNKKPVLVLTYDPPGKQPKQILRIWRSNYHLLQIHQPIWLGSVQARVVVKKKKQRPVNAVKKIASIKYVTLALAASPTISLRLFPLPSLNSLSPTEFEPMILLIKDLSSLKENKL